MSDEEEFDEEKTQIFLPGGKPLMPPKAGDSNQGVLLKPGAPAAQPAPAAEKEATTVDFDITSGAGFDDDAPIKDSPKSAAADAAAAAAAVKARDAARPQPSVDEGPGLLSVIIGLLILAALAWFALR